MPLVGARQLHWLLRFAFLEVSGTCTIMKFQERPSWQSKGEPVKWRSYKIQHDAQGTTRHMRPAALSLDIFDHVWTQWQEFTIPCLSVSILFWFWSATLLCLSSHRTGEEKRPHVQTCKKIKLVQAPPDQGASRGKVQTQTQNERTSNNKTNPIHAPIHDIFSKNGTWTNHNKSIQIHQTSQWWKSLRETYRSRDVWKSESFSSLMLGISGHNSRHWIWCHLPPRNVTFLRSIQRGLVLHLGTHFDRLTGFSLGFQG